MSIVCPPIVCPPVKPLSVYKIVNYRTVGAPCRFGNNKCKSNGVCSPNYNEWGMCDHCGNWKRRNRVSFNNNV